jgi:hypothetical protein
MVPRQLNQAIAAQEHVAIKTLRLAGLTLAFGRFAPSPANTPMRAPIRSS